MLRSLIDGRSQPLRPTSLAIVSDLGVCVECPNLAELGRPPPGARDRRRSTHSGPTAHPIAAIRPVFYRFWAVATGSSFRLRSATQSIIGT